MKRRVRKIANFFAFNLLFFALYLNFIHKDKAAITGVNQPTASQTTTEAFSGTVLVDNPIQQKKSEATVTTGQTATTKPEEGNTEALKLAIN